MNPNITFSIFLIFLSQLGFSQQEKRIKGKITIKDASPLGVIVLNLVTEKETVAEANGEFSILAKQDDLLVFYAPNLDKQRKIIEQKEYESQYFEIEMTSKVEQLEEVEIVNSRINAVSLGILSKPAKRYTPAERRLYASESSALDSFLNALSRRKKMLKDNVVTEKKESLLQKLEGLYDENFYTETLHIESEFIKAFHFYIVENQKFTDALQNKNQFMTNLLIIDLAREYKALHSYDKE